MYLGRTKLALVWTSSMFIKLTYADIYSDFHSNKLALGMLSDAPLVTFLKERPQITTIKFCLDNDKPGRTAFFHGSKVHHPVCGVVSACPVCSGGTCGVSDYCCHSDYL